MPDSIIVEILQNIPTYKTYKALSVIKKVCLSLNSKSNILIIGAGQGAETIVFNRFCKEANITVVDHWSCEAKIKSKGIYNNSKLNFIENINKYNVKLNKLYDDCILYDNFIEKQLIGPWDCIYYDAIDGANEWEIKMVKSILPQLWSKINQGGYLIGDDYYFKMPQFKMTPLVEDFCYQHNIILDFDTKQESYHWLIKKD